VLLIAASLQTGLSPRPTPAGLTRRSMRDQRRRRNSICSKWRLILTPDTATSPVSRGGLKPARGPQNCLLPFRVANHHELLCA
jgi:hypothetical protein